MTFKARTTKPEAGNKYYNTRANGGYSDAIKGKPTDKDCDVLSNCVGYAYGRFNEIGGWGCCKYLKPVNAENFMQYAGDCKTGMTPKLGACMVWRKGATLSGSDGAGHVAIVEKVVSDTEVVTSESGYNSYAFRTKTRTKGNGNWGAGTGYTFLGFIYNPAVKDEPNRAKQFQQAAVADGFRFPKYGADGVWGTECEDVAKKAIVRKYLVYKYKNLTKLVQGIVGADQDGKCGTNTVNAIRAWQKANGLTVDGCFGRDCWKRWCL